MSRVSRTLRISSTSRAIPSESGDSKGGAVTLDNKRNKARAPRGVSRLADAAVRLRLPIRSLNYASPYVSTNESDFFKIRISPASPYRTIAELCLTLKLYGNENQGERDKGNDLHFAFCVFDREGF